MVPPFFMENYHHQLVSIGIPVYNVEAYIEKCLTSVLSQSYENIEVLVVNDCGTDKSMEIVNRIKNTHNRGNTIKIIHHKKNWGLSEARNSAINSAKGEYIFFIDSDDFIKEDAIETMVTHAYEHHADIVMGSIVCYYPQTDNTTPAFQYRSYQVIEGKNAFAHYVCKSLRESVSTLACNVLFRRQMLIENEIHFFGRICEEFLFIADYYPHVSTAVLLPEVTYYYVIRSDSLMGRGVGGNIPVEKIRDRFAIDKKITEHSRRLSDTDFFDAHCARVMKHKFRGVCTALRHRNRFTERLTNQEIVAELAHPATFPEIMSFRRYRLFNLCFYVLGHLPSSISVSISYLLGKAMRWI